MGITQIQKDGSKRKAGNDIHIIITPICYQIVEKKP